MNSYTLCLQCFVRQAMNTLELATQDIDLQQRTLQQVLGLLSQADLRESPPSIARSMYQLIHQACDCPDPYAQIKETCHQAALVLLPNLREQIQNSEHPMEQALRMAMAGNVIDFGVQKQVDLEAVESEIEQACQTPLDQTTLDALLHEIDHAKQILYLADNAGEIMLDTLFIDQIGRERVTLAVRSDPIINDVCLADAQSWALTNDYSVISNGLNAPAPGTLLSDCSDAFKQTFAQADLIISKGQGNYETLHDHTANLFFILKLKCPIAARMAGQTLGQWLITRPHPEPEDSQ